MDWPTTPTENIPGSDFVPEFCPWPACPTHDPEKEPPFGFSGAGSYQRKCDGRVVPRFRCAACRRTFSQQSFAATYYLKRPELLIPIARAMVACEAHRQTARSLECAASTVTRQAARIGRHAILLQTITLQNLDSLEETVVYDHFECFGVSQYFPVGIGTAYGEQSRLLLSLDVAPLRRKGRMSPMQKRRRSVLELSNPRPSPRAYEQAAREMLDRLLPLLAPGSSLHLASDEHKQYATAVRKHPQSPCIEHKAYANPSRGPKGTPRSARARRRDKALETVDQGHQFLRHSLSHHRRETIAFARRHNALVERIFAHGVWLNYVKNLSENAPQAGTRAMKAGLTDERWSWERIFARRLQPFRVPLPESWATIYRRQLKHPRCAEGKEHKLINAF